MHDDQHHFDHSVRDGIFDGSADDIQDLSHPDFEDDDFPHSRRRSRSGRHDLSGAPSWVKAFIWAGVLLAMSGFGVILFGVVIPLITHDPFTPTFPVVDPTPILTVGDLPPGFPADQLPPEFRPVGPTNFPSTTGQFTRPTFDGTNLALGFGLFFTGFVLTAIGALGHSTSTRR
ncbi:hypothetical protein OG205_23515 [Lentzea sp. NBC_00516]|uniref:hypothetical protein n=1 Tax=Lentzea sp. NBC_00516 TaxID=2903582 RepID=UPI002E8230B1|nr:hypothetical protein [Lentzea sp. NBC_00516]WUD21121.1 hypothetical protein OG205_23515 [Lentzea sp. NBC_00516]